MRTDRAVSERVANKDEHVDRVSIRLIVDRILDTRLWKYYLGPTSLRPVTIYLTFWIDSESGYNITLKSFRSHLRLTCLGRELRLNLGPAHDHYIGHL